MASDKSHQLNLYDPTDANRFYIENEAAGVTFRDDNLTRKLKVYVSEMQIFDAGPEPGAALEVKAKFAEGDSERVANAAAIVVTQTSVATEQARAVAAEGGNLALVQAEAARAGAAEALIQADVNANELASDQAEAALDAKIDAQKVSYEAADLVERNRALAAEAGLQSQISNILSDATPAVLDDLASIVAAFQSGDATLQGQFAALQASYNTLAAQVAALTNNA